jgi:hypothetical protein
MDEVLGNANSRNAVLQRNSHQPETICAVRTCNVCASSACVLASSMPFSSLYWMRPVSESAGNEHGLAILSTDSLKHLHELWLHLILASVFAVKLRLLEVGVVVPVHLLISCAPRWTILKLPAQLAILQYPQAVWLM